MKLDKLTFVGDEEDNESKLAMEICERANKIWVFEGKTKRGQEGERSQTNLKKKQITNKTQTKIPAKDKSLRLSRLKMRKKGLRENIG